MRFGERKRGRHLVADPEGQSQIGEKPKGREGSRQFHFTVMISVATEGNGPAMLAVSWLKGTMKLMLE